jgi:hypothetical protein
MAMLRQLPIVRSNLQPEFGIPTRVITGPTGRSKDWPLDRYPRPLSASEVLLVWNCPAPMIAFQAKKGAFLVRVLLISALSIGALTTSSAAQQTSEVRVSSVRDCSVFSTGERDLVPLAIVCEAVKMMEKSLPNFVCEQTTQRYFPFSAIYRKSEARRPDDTVSNTVSATVIYENGADRYANVKIGDRPVEGNKLDLLGPITSGDFGSELLSIFRVENGVTFKLREQVTRPGGGEYVFDFRIPAAMNHAFTLIENGLQARPDLEGAIWVDRNTGSVRRLDLLAKNIGPGFSADHIRFSSFFGKVRFGDDSEFRLAQWSEATICDRGRLCTHNVTQWKNCKRLSVQTRITFGASSGIHEKGPSGSFQPLAEDHEPATSVNPVPSEAQPKSADADSAPAVDEKPKVATEAVTNVARVTRNGPGDLRANKDVPHSTGFESGSEQEFEAFIAAYPNSISDESTVDRFLQTYRSGEDSAKLISYANQLLTLKPDNVLALAVLVFENNAQARNSSDRIQAARFRTDSADLSRRGLDVIENAQRPAGITREDYERFLSRVTPLFYFALAAPIDQTSSEEDSRSLLESKNWTSTIIEIQPNPITDAPNARQARAIIVNQRELLVCTGHCSPLGPGIYSGEVRNSQVRISVPSKKRGKTSISTFRIAGTW